MKNKKNENDHRNKNFYFSSTFPSRIETIPHFQERYPPLTFARLEKKNKLDSLSRNKRKNKIERRYSFIANIQHHLPTSTISDNQDSIQFLTSQKTKSSSSISSSLPSSNNRVINVRGCESAPIKLSVNEIKSLAKFLCAIHFETRFDKKTLGENENESNVHENLNNSFQEYNPIRPLSPKIDDTFVAPSTSTSIPTFFHFPAQAQDQQPQQQYFFAQQGAIALPLNSSNSSNNNNSFFKSLILEQVGKWIHFAKNFYDTRVLGGFQYFMIDNNEGIQFDGWSLWLFSPKSNIRLYLWSIIASRWYGYISLILLFSQWIVLSSITIYDHDQKLNPYQLQVFILCIINAVLLFEIISKVIVYGFVLKHISSDQPNLLDKIKESFIINPLEKINTVYSAKILNIFLSNHPNQPQDLSQDRQLNKMSRRIGSNRSFNSYNTNDDAESNQAPWCTNAVSTTSLSRLHKSSSYISLKSPLSSLKSPLASIKSSFESLKSPLNNNNNNNNNGKSNVHHNEQQMMDNSSDNMNIYEDSQYSHHSQTGRHIENNKDTSPALDQIYIRHHPFLNGPRNYLDLISALSFWVHVILLVNNVYIPILPVLASLRVLRFLTITDGTTIIMQSLGVCLDVLTSVIGLFIFFWLLFSLFALFVFTNAFSRQCAIMPENGISMDIKNVDLIYATPQRYCNSYYDSLSHKSGYFDIDIGKMFDVRSSDGYTCQLGQICIQSVDNLPSWHYINYNNIFFSMINVFTVISMEDWTELMYMTQDSISTITASLFYCTCIYIMSFILVPMFVAVITTSFSNLRGTLRQSAFARNKKTKVLLTRQANVNEDAGNTNDQDANKNEEWTYSGHNTTTNQLYHQNKKLRHYIQIMVNSKYYVLSGSLLSFLNMVFMIIYSSNLQKDNLILLEQIEKLLNYAFLLDIILRLYGSYSLFGFWRLIRNRFDALICIGSLFNIFIVDHNSQTYRILQILSVSKCYRIVYFFPSVLQLLSDIIGDGQGIINLTFFTFMVLFLFCPIATQFFGGDFQDIGDWDDPAMKFDNFYQSFLSLYQVMTGENWTDILYDSMHSQAYSTVIFAGVFMVTLYFIIHYIVMNLFIAVIMENFDLDEDEIRNLQIKKYIRYHRWQPEYFQLDVVSRFLLPIFISQEQRKANIKTIPKSLLASINSNLLEDFLKNKNHTTNDSARSNGQKDNLVLTILSNFGSSKDFNENYREKPDKVNPVKYGDEYENNVAMENKTVVIENLRLFKSFGFINSNNAMRLWCLNTINSSIYNQIVVGMVFASFTMATITDRYFRINYPIATEVVEYIQYVLLGFYFMDVLFRMIAFGIVMLPKSYLRKIWNVVDLMVLLAQLCIILFFKSKGIVVEEEELGSQSILRCLRTFRILNLVHHVEGMRVLFFDLMHGVPKMMDAVALNLLVFISFAIYGCFLFGGKFTSCNDDAIDVKYNCYGEYRSDDGDNLNILIPRTWKNPYEYSFDNFGKALLHLVEISSGEGWILSLFSAMSITSEADAQPNFNWASSSIWYSLYYIVFMFVASLCTIQLFIGVFLETFKQRNGISSLTNPQRQYQDLQKQLSLEKPTPILDRPESDIKAMCYDLIVDKREKFSYIMMYISLANIAVFATDFLDKPVWLAHLLGNMYYGFLVLYTIEIAIKAFGMGINKFIFLWWNIYDIIVLPIAITTCLLRSLINDSFLLDVIFHLAQIALAFRLARRIESLDTLLKAIKKALPSIAYTTGVFTFVIFIFAVIFQELFDNTSYGPYGHHNANFRTIGISVLTLFRMTTGENWDFLMHDFSKESPNCVEGKDCGSHVAAYILFILFYVVCTYIFVNLFTVIVINNFSFTIDKQSQLTIITRKDIRFFKDAWAEYDPMATGYIQKQDIPRFLRNLQGNLCVRIYSEPHTLNNLLKASDREDIDVNHLASVPLCSARLYHQFASNNILGERYYNFYEVNKELSTMDLSAIRKNKDNYNHLYQELLLSSTSRGISFHDTLKILTLRLVDPTKALTFDRFVQYSRQQENINKILAQEKIENVVRMLKQRQKYIKYRQQYRDKQIINEELYGTSSTSTSGDSISDISDEYELKRSSVIIETINQNNNSIYDINNIDHQNNNKSLQELSSHELTNKFLVRAQTPTSSISPSGSPVPAIVINLSPNKKDKKEETLKYENSNHSNPSLLQPSGVFEHLSGFNDSHPYQFTNTASSSSSSSSSNEASLYEPKPTSKLKGKMKAGSENIISNTINGSVDAFTVYYAQESNIDSMVFSDVIAIVKKLEDNEWCGLLQELSVE
ncbi:Ion transport protein-domain-containing protein [Cunninghamella echinulata]|nr:Ion transport protein-domain-containing protein [Cunninghamella echinulata]